MTTKKTEELFAKAIAATRKGVGRNVVFGHSPTTRLGSNDSMSERFSHKTGIVYYDGKPITSLLNHGWTPVGNPPAPVAKAVREAIFSMPDNAPAGEIRREIVSRLQDRATGLGIQKSSIRAGIAKPVSKGYVSCACPDCFDTAIAGKRGPHFCHQCKDAGCETTGECQRSDAYGQDEDAFGYTPKATKYRGKIKPEHFAEMNRRLDAYLAQRKINFQDEQDKYRKAGLSDKRFRWDLFAAAISKPFDLTSDIYKYANDDHIDTALRHIVQTRS